MIPGHLYQAALTGVVVAPLAGLVVDRTGHFWWAFVVATTVTLLGGASWVFLTGPLAQVKWPRETDFAFDKFVLTPRREAAGANPRPNDPSIVADSKSIAVLPFVNMSANENDEYLSDGMTEELKYDDAIAQARKTLETDPNSAISHVLLGLSLLKKGDTAGAIAELQISKAPDPGAWYQGFLGYAYAISGERAKAEEALRDFDQLAKRQYVSPTAFATIYLGLGQKEKCLDWLEKAYEQQDSACWYLKIDQIYDSVRNEPRFQALIQKVFGQTQ